MVSIDLAQAQRQFALFAKLFKQGLAVACNVGFGKVNRLVGDGVMGFAVIGNGIVEKGPIQVLLPQLATAALETHDVGKAQLADAACDFFGGIDLVGRQQTGDAFEEKTAVNQDGDSSAAHSAPTPPAPIRRRPETKKPQGFGTLPG